MGASTAGTPPAPDRRDLARALGVPDLEPAALELALTHRSYAYEHGGLPTNERLEFLGDAVLGLVVTDDLYTRHPDLSEGRLAKLRAAVVNAKALAEVGRTLGVGDHLRLGRGEDASGGREKSSILADTVEALIGAVYVQFGFEVATRVVRAMFVPLVAAAATKGAGLDWKTSLQELSAMHDLGVPEYLVDESGPDHAKWFTARARVGDQYFGSGSGRSKKDAEQQAAETAWQDISGRYGAADGS